MPMTGKTRGIKRSSGTSYSSTVTVITFLAVCGLGLWLLTSNSFTPPQSITRTSTNTPTPMRPIARPNNPKPFINQENTPHEDVPGEFPEDITKSVNPTMPEIQEPQIEQNDMPSNIGGGSSHDTKGGNDIPKIDNDLKIEATSNDHDPGVGQNMEKLQEKESVKEQDKQAALGNQATEESTMTQKQEVKQIPVQAQNSENRAAEKSVPDPLQNHISEEDQRKRVEEHQHQEDAQVQKGKEEARAKQDPHGATSGDQIQHDNAAVHSAAPPETLSQKIGEIKLSEQTTAIPKESTESKKSWSTQAHQSENEKERRYTWQLCNVTAGADYIPCLDNEKAIAKIHKREHYQHRERHCPEEPPICLVQLPNGYKRSIEWPQSRDKIWYHNVPHTLLAEVKGHQNWVKKTGEFLTFPGGGTQFIHGALHYIDFIQKAVPEIAWGKHTRVVLDVGCGVASFGGFLFERDVLAMSFAPKDEHEAQVQFALERGIPAISAVMGSQRLQFPSRVFDLVHCARCRVPWHADGGALLLELNRVLRPGGYFVWSATPVYQKEEEDVEIWKEMSRLTVAMCWELVTIKKDKLNSVGAAIYHKPDSNDCYDQRKKNDPPMCKNEDDSSAAWYVPLQSCMHRVPTEETARGSQWPDEWPKRVQTPPYWLNKSQNGIYGKPAPEDFASDYEHWKKVVSKSYMSDLGINWSNVRNVMDMRAVYGGFAAALKDLKVWVMNVVNVDSPDTLPIIYERGLFGIYHDWCESFSTYPRTYDLLHADHLFSKLKTRCKLVAVMAEVDRMARPGGKLIMRDESSTITEVENLLKSLHWEVHLTFSKNQDGILSAQKSDWRPDTYAAAS